jgi:hypothetical protein
VQLRALRRLRHTHSHTTTGATPDESIGEAAAAIGIIAHQTGIPREKALAGGIDEEDGCGCVMHGHIDGGVSHAVDVFSVKFVENIGYVAVDGDVVTAGGVRGSRGCFETETWFVKKRGKSVEGNALHWQGGGAAECDARACREPHG